MTNVRTKTAIVSLVTVVEAMETNDLRKEKMQVKHKFRQTITEDQQYVKQKPTGYCVYQ